MTRLLRKSISEHCRYRGHQAYLQSAPSYNFPMYRQLVHEITQTFKKISDEIIDIENKLRAQHSLPEVAKFIAKVQEEEKLKLETVGIHVRRKTA